PAGRRAAEFRKPRRSVHHRILSVLRLAGIRSDILRPRHRQCDDDIRHPHDRAQGRPPRGGSRPAPRGCRAWGLMLEKPTNRAGTAVTELSITVVGAGIMGLWQAYAHARAGHRVRLVERSHEPFAESA